MTREFDKLPRDEQLASLQGLAETALACFDLPKGATPVLINQSENATYRIDAPDGGRWALRIHRDGYHSRTAIASELAWMEAIRKDGAAITPTAIPGRDDELIQTVSYAALTRPRHVVLFEWETGEEPDEHQQDLRGPFEVLGEIAARMHLQARRWQRPDWFERHTWDFETSLGSRPHWGGLARRHGVDAGNRGAVCTYG